MTNKIIKDRIFKVNHKDPTKEPFLDMLYCSNNILALKQFPKYLVDLTITSPPYDKLRDYEGFELDLDSLIEELYRVTKKGGIVIWVVNDMTKNYSESGNSFRQALKFIDKGFKLYDTMIYQKENPVPMNHRRYEQCFEYMFVFSRGRPKTFNPIKVPCKHAGKITSTKKTHRKLQGISDELVSFNTHGPTKEEKIKRNIWTYSVGYNKTTTDDIAYEHPAVFPEQLVYDHIISWSNKGDTVLDPMVGSGTTTKIAKALGRRYIGIDLSEKYIEIANKRTESVKFGELL